MQNRLVWSFADKCNSAKSVEEVRGLFLRDVDTLGFAHVACCSHVDPLKPPREAVTMLHYPMPWLERFSENNYAKRDPVFLAARRQALPFQWSDLRFRKGLAADQLRILNEASEAGLGDGFTIPLHSPGALPASCSLVFGPDGVDPLDVRTAHWYAVYAHEAARRILVEQAPLPARPLSPRERQALEWVARGKEDAAIVIILGIQQSTAHNTVQRAMKKYGVATRALVQGVDLRRIGHGGSPVWGSTRPIRA